MGLNLQLSPLTLPEGTEFPGQYQQLIDQISQYLLIVGGEDFTGVAYGSTQPSEEERSLWWARTDGGGNPLGWYAWDGLAWSPLPVSIPSGSTADRPASPPTGTLYFDTDIEVEIIYYNSSWHTTSGSPGDVKFVTGVSLSAVLTKNPGWSNYTAGIGKVIAGAAADGSNAQTTAGADSITLTEDQMPTHTHEDLIVTGSEADNGDDGGLTVMAATQSIGQKTVTNSQTGPKGGSDPVDIRQSTLYLFTLVKD